MTCLRFLYIFGGSGLSTVRHLWPGCLSNALSREVFFRIKRFTDIFSAKTHQTCKKSKLNLSVGKDAFRQVELLSYGIWGTAFTVVFQSLQNSNVCNENFNFKSRNGHAASEENYNFFQWFWIFSSNPHRSPLTQHVEG